MNPVPPFIGKHWKGRITAHDIAFYYAKGCKIFPPLYTFYINELISMERQGRLCLTPQAVLEKYHLELRRRIEEHVRKIARVVDYKRRAYNP